MPGFPGLIPVPAAVNGRLHFGTNAVQDRELWTSDETPGHHPGKDILGTRRVPEYLTAGGTLYFTANTARSSRVWSPTPGRRMAPNWQGDIHASVVIPAADARRHEPFFIANDGSAGTNSIERMGPPAAQSSSETRGQSSYRTS